MSYIKHKNIYSICQGKSKVKNIKNICNFFDDSFMNNETQGSFGGTFGWPEESRSLSSERLISKLCCKESLENAMIIK
jgi:hypothetical protein